MNRQEVRDNQAGFTLIEAMISILVMTISLLGLAQLMMVSLEKHEFAKYDTKATHIAQAKLEELQTVFGWQIQTGSMAIDLAAGGHGPLLVSLKAPSGSYNEPRDFWVSWIVSDSMGGQKQVAVTVAPPVVNPRFNKKVTLTALFSP